MFCYVICYVKKDEVDIAVAAVTETEPGGMTDTGDDDDDDDGYQDRR